MLARFITKIKTLINAAWAAVKPGPAAVRGAALGLLAVATLVYIAFVLLVNRGPLLYVLPAILVMLGLGALLLWLGQGIAWVIGLLARIPWPYRWALFAALLLLSISSMGINPAGLLAAAGLVLLAASLLGAGIGSIRRGWGRLTRVKRVVALGGIVTGGVALAGLLWVFLAWRGTAPTAVVDAAKQSGAPVEEISLPNPALPGPYAVETLTYGSGSDYWRPEFGEGAILKTTPVDGSNLLEGSWKGFPGQLRSFAWGFDAQALPLNGRVWYPGGAAGSGPFPLVLMVHGNHDMMDFSDPGYAYLGELLASRGYIFVSVDENFINSGTVDLFEGMQNENDARGWLLLEHLRQWHAWNADPDNPFYHMVDTRAIAVAGHSRGGEAAAVAAAFNRMPYYPDNAGQVFAYQYGIRAVVAIAPIDGQYVPAWRGTELENVDYFLIHGSNDSDVVSFDGLDQFERATFDPGSQGFKTAIYVYRANHGQFNTTWGDSDAGGLLPGALARDALLSGEEQRQAALVYISAFLDASLKGERGYLPLFQDARAAGDGWLPDTIFINRLEQAGDLVLAGYEEDANLATLTLEDGAASGVNLDTWREQRVNGKWGGREESAVYLGWNEEGSAAYTLTLPQAGLDLAPGSSLIFKLADANQDPDHAEGFEPEAEKSKPPEAGPRQPLDLSVRLVDAAGETAQLTLSDFLLVQPIIQVDLFKLALFEKGATSEPVLQSYALPLERFTRANPGFDPLAVRSISFVFDRTPRGSVILDGVGFRPPSP